MTEEIQSRRAMDTEQHEIERLIAREDDPKIRLQLMIMNRINLSLIANTQTITEVASKLDDHLTNYEEHTKADADRLNQGRGAWKVITWVLGVIQVIGLGIWVDVRADIHGIHSFMTEATVTDAKLATRLDAIETRLAK